MVSYIFPLLSPFITWRLWKCKKRDAKKALCNNTPPSVKEKRKILREKGACWSCLRRGHRIQDCKSKRACGVNGCEKRHHKSLHEEVSTDAIAKVCNQNIKPCLLQVQKIQMKTGWANVLWDTGASLSFITNKKAKSEKLKGTKTELSVVKVGGMKETLRPPIKFGNYSVLLYLYFTVIIFLIRLLCVTYRFRTTLTKNKQQFETHGFGCVSQQNTY